MSRRILDLASELLVYTAVAGLLVTTAYFVDMLPR